MTNSTLNSITIAQLRQQFDLKGGFGNDFIISSNREVHNLQLFKYPCRLDALVCAICTQGRVTVTINLKKYEISAGTMVVNLPENIIQTISTSDDFRGHIIVGAADFLKEMLIDLKNVITVYMQVKNHPCVVLQQDELQVLQHYYTLLEENLNCPNDNLKLDIVRNLGASLLYKCCSILNAADFNEDKAPQKRKEAFFKQFMELLSRHHREQRSVGFYAGQMHITPKYMSGLIKEVSGKSAAQWIDEYVVLEAKALLKYSEMSIQQVAYHFNFPTQSFFGKYFKHHTGMSPSQYKAQ